MDSTTYLKVLKVNGVETMNERFTITVESTANQQIPAVVRLRAALKVLLRGFGLRCLEAREIESSQVSDANSQPP